MDRRFLGWWVSVAGAASLGLFALFYSTTAAPLPRQATPAPVDCGTPVESWGPAIADDVEVALLRVIEIDVRESLRRASPVATPPLDADATFFAEIEVVNLGTSVADVVANDIALVLCDGTVLAPVTNTSRPALGEGPLRQGDMRSGWIAFMVPSDAVPIRLIVPVTRPGLTGGRVEFPLVDPTGVAGGTPGTNGADAVGGDAFGGDGEDGADATAESGS